MKFFTAAASALAISLAGSAAMAACESGEIVIKFSHVTNTDRHPKGIAASLFQQRVNDEMNGVACMEVFPNSTLYNDDQVLEAMLQGDVQLAAPRSRSSKLSPSNSGYSTCRSCSRTSKRLMLSRPLKPVQAMKDSMARRGLHGLEFWHNGMKQFSANVPLELPTEPLALNSGFSPLTCWSHRWKHWVQARSRWPFPRFMARLQTGVVDGQENTWSNICGQKFFEVQDGVTETNHGIIDYLVVVSVDWLRQGWTPMCATSSLTILREVTVARNGEAFAVNESAKQSIIDAGGVIRQLDTRATPSLGRRDEASLGQVRGRCRCRQHSRGTGNQRLDVSLAIVRPGFRNPGRTLLAPSG